MVREGAEANKYEVDPFPEYVLYLRVRTALNNIKSTYYSTWKHPNFGLG